jgi:small-conductance mechanosensitive channel
MIMSTVLMLKKITSAPQKLNLEKTMKEEVVEKILEYLNETQDFVLEQLPQVIQQALRYEKVAAFVLATLMLVLLTLAIFVFYYSLQHPGLDKYGSRSTASVLGMFLPGALSAFLFIQFCVSADRLIKIYLAPKYFLIQLILSMKD